MTTATEADVLVFGTAIRLRADDNGLLRALIRRLPPSSTPAVGGGPGRCYGLARAGEGLFTLTADDTPLANGIEEHTLAAFHRDVDSYVAEWSPDCVFVHAGVVEWRGSAVVLPGRSFAGKTTLTAALLEAGATYLSDEFAVLDADGRVHAYPRPLGLRDAADDTRQSSSAATLHSALGTEARSIGLVVVTRYESRLPPWRPRPLSPGHGALELLANTVSARRDPGRALRVLGRVAARALFVKADRGEARTVAPAILELAERTRAA